MSTNMSFEPFIDYDAVTEEMAANLHAALRSHRAATLKFAEKDTPDLKLCADVLRAAQEANVSMHAILGALYTQPMMVHVAGQRREETNPDNEEQSGVIQRCARCGSILHFWTEGIIAYDQENGPHEMELDEVRWWQEGDVVAKANSDDGSTMYLIEGRELESHERECADLTGLVSLD